MAAPVVGGAHSGSGSVRVVFSPPLEFIARQAGLFGALLRVEMGALWEGFKPIMGAMEEEQWATHGQGEWPPLAASTLARKTSGEMMVETGDLKDSLVDPNRAMRVQGMSAEYGTNVSYAHFHQDGGSITGRPPQRRVIPDPVPVERRRELEVVMVAWVNRISAKTWGRI